MSAIHPSCIKIPGSKESSQYQNSRTQEPDIHDQIFTKNDLVSMASETFGSDKWNHAVTNQTLDFVEYVNGKYYVGCAAFVRVQLSDGLFHEEMGYSNSDGTNKGLTIFSARTGSITNAFKNALLCFGGEIAAKIKNYSKQKSEHLNSVPSLIDEPQRIITKSRINIIPQAQSTPQKITDKSVLSEKKNGASSLAVIDEKNSSSAISIIQQVESNGKTQTDKPVLTDEERRLERKRRQAQKQEEYKRLREKEAAEKPNARF